MRIWGAVVLPLCFGLAACAGDSAVPVTSEPWFQEMAGPSGLDFQHVRAAERRHWLPEIMSGGACWLDFDGDGDLDLYLVQGGDLNQASVEGNRLFRNQGDTWTDVTEAAGVGDTGYGMGCAVGDTDGDGDPDLYVTNVGANVLFRNQADGTFCDVTVEAGVGHSGWGTSAAFLDYDRDGSLDLFVANYVNWSPARELECFSGGRGRDYCQPQNYNAPATDVLYRNQGGGRFADATFSAGLAQAKGNGLGVVGADFDGDGWIDIYVANDGDVDILVVDNHGPARLLRNRAPREGYSWIQFRLQDRDGREAPGAVVRVSAGDRSWRRLAHRAYSYLSGNDPRVHIGLGEVQHVDAVEVRWPDGESQRFGPFSAGRVHLLRRER